MRTRHEQTGGAIATDREERVLALEAASRQRILILDGAMGTAGTPLIVSVERDAAVKLERDDALWAGKGGCPAPVCHIGDIRSIGTR